MEQEQEAIVAKRSRTVSPADEQVGQVLPAASGEQQALREAALLCTQRFPSLDEAMEAALKVMASLLKSQTLFLARLDQREEAASEAEYESNRAEKDEAAGTSERSLTIVKALNRAESSFPPGSVSPATLRYCRIIYRRVEPLIIEDVRNEPFFVDVPLREGAEIGSYIGVPLIASDGRIYGMLCGIDAQPQAMRQRPELLELLQILARFLMLSIEREELTAQLQAAERLEAQLALQAQQAHSEAEARARQLETTFGAMNESVFVFDSNGRIIQVNAAARKLFADSSSDSFSVWPGRFMRNEQGELLSKEQWPTTRILRGEVLTGHNIDVITYITRERKVQLSVSGAPFYNQLGVLSGGVVVFHDVTEQRLQERRTQEAFAALLSMAEALVWLPEEGHASSAGEAPSYLTIVRNVGQRLVELTYRLLNCQHASIAFIESGTNKLYPVATYGMSPKYERFWWRDVGSSALNDYLDEADVARFRANEVVIRDLIRHPFVARPHYGIHTLLFAPMLVGEQLVGVLGLEDNSDISSYTEEKIALAKAVAKLAALIMERERLLHERAEARANELMLREANRRFDEFLSIASHELRNPLTAIKGNIQLSKRRLKNLKRLIDEGGNMPVQKYEEVQRSLERAERQVEVQNRLVGDLIDVSRIQSNRLELILQRCDLALIVREAVEDQRQVALTRTITLEMAEGETPVYVDAVRIGQVVNNYLTNALKYSEEDRPVRVQLERDSSKAWVLVSDAGPGLAEGEKERIWERFYRVPGVYVLSGSGTGLGMGLHISRTLIERHEGQVGVESTPGSGSTFWFSLPLLQAEEAAGEQ